MLAGGNEDNDLATAMLEELRSMKEDMAKMANRMETLPADMADSMWTHINDKINRDLGKSARKMIQMAVVAIGMFFAVMMLPWDKFK